MKRAQKRGVAAAGGLLLTVAAGPALGVVVWDEGVNGALSANQNAPTALALAVGTNSVIGVVGGGASNDFVAVTVPAGFELSGYVLAAYTSLDVQGFTGFTNGATFPGSIFSAGSYRGYAHYGTGATNGALPPTNLVGQDLMPIMSNPALAAGSTGFTPPLAAGTYTFNIQQLGGTTNYQFDFVVTEAVAPPGPCAGDADGNNVVNFTDVTSVLANFGADYSPGTGAGDANHNGPVNFSDVTAVLANFGSDCTP